MKLYSFRQLTGIQIYNFYKFCKAVDIYSLSLYVFVISLYVFVILLIITFIPSFMYI